MLKEWILFFPVLILVMFFYVFLANFIDKRSLNKKGYKRLFFCLFLRKEATKLIEAAENNNRDTWNELVEKLGIDWSSEEIHPGVMEIKYSHGFNKEVSFIFPWHDEEKPLFTVIVFYKEIEKIKTKEIINQFIKGIRVSLSLNQPLCK